MKMHLKLSSTSSIPKISKTMQCSIEANSGAPSIF